MLQLNENARPTTSSMVGSSTAAMVRPTLLLGSADVEASAKLLQGHGVTHILQVGHEFTPSHAGLFNYKSISIDDLETEDLLKQLPAALAYMDEAVAAGGKVFVHCAAGVSRSPSVCIGYLMAREQLPLEAAFKRVQEARPCIQPNIGFLFQLWDFGQMGCRTDGWPGWSRARFSERLREYAQARKEVEAYAGMPWQQEGGGEDEPVQAAMAALVPHPLNVDALRLAAQRASRGKPAKAEEE